MVTKGEGGGGDELRGWDWQMYTSVYRMDDQQGPAT